MGRPLVLRDVLEGMDAGRLENVVLNRREVLHDGFGRMAGDALFVG